MPFVMVYRMPRVVSNRTLLALRKELVAITSELMGCSKKWVGVDFFKATLPEAFDEDEGCSTVLVKLETALFSSPTNTQDNDMKAMLVLEALAEAIWLALDGKYEVEAAISEWNSKRKYLKEAIT